jgi:hypothetical protein
MVKSCRDKETAKVLALTPSRKFQAIQESDEEVLIILDSATSLRDLALPGLRSKNCWATGKVNTAFVSTVNTGSASNGDREMPSLLKLSIIIRRSGDAGECKKKGLPHIRVEW